MLALIDLVESLVSLISVHALLDHLLIETAIGACSSLVNLRVVLGV